MRAALTAIAAILFAFTATAQPTITSITPNKGPVTGGTTVTIRGTGFTNNCPICSPPFADPQVTFGGAEAKVRFIDATTLEVVTPARIPGATWVTVRNYDASGSAFRDNAFTFEGNITDAFEPILFPIFMQPVQGLFGSEFHTFPRMTSFVDGFEPIYGVDTSCTTIDPPIYPNFAFVLMPQVDYNLIPGCNGSVGHLFWVRKAIADQIAANLRVSDVTRQANSHGVEIPVVRRRDFRQDRVVLLGVPIDARYRPTLRVYSLERGEGYVLVQIGNEIHELPLIAPADEFTPWYAAFTDFPAPEELPGGTSTVRVVVGAPRSQGPDSPQPPLWAFVTVTNNETQHITTVTPN